MHIKVVQPNAYDFSEPVATLVKCSSRGLVGEDRRQFEKRASVDFTRELSQIKTAADEPLIHLLIIGATEAYGMNRNGDGFRQQACRDYHPTFVKYAKFFRDHKNKDARKSYGRPVASAFNERMKRIELLVALNGSKEAADRHGGLVADKELEKLARGDDLPISMACVTDPTYPVLTRDRGYIGIAEIRVGDNVWTQQGRWRRVTQLNRRRYTGTVYEFRVNGLPRPLELTADHPMWAKVFAGSRKADAVKLKARRYFQDSQAFVAAPAGWTHAEHVGVGDRFFYRPITRYPGYGQIADIALATVMGYYLAEGSFLYNGDRACTTQFSCHVDDSLPRRLPRLVETMFPDVEVQIHPRHNSKPGLSVDVHSTEFSEFLRKYVGRGVAHKRIAPEIFNATREIKLAFLGAWLDGDGWVDKNGGHWSTANYALALEGRDLLASVGIPSSIYMIDHAKCPTSGYVGSGVEYVLNVAHLDLWNLSEASEKVAAYPTPAQQRTKPASMRYCPDGTYAYRVAAVESRAVTDIETYNVEVEEDESYSLGGLISHNCRVAFDVCSFCGNRASTRAEYCMGIDEGGMCKAGGLKHRIGSLVDVDGVLHALHADNPHPTFFDCSHVFRPADRIAYVLGQLEKTASSQGRRVTGAELAATMGVTIPYELLVEQNYPSDVRRMLKLAYVLADLEQEITHGECPAAAHAFTISSQGACPSPPPYYREKFAQFLRSLVDARICLSPEHFVQLIAGCSQEKAAAVAEIVRQALPGIYSRMLSSEEFVEKVAGNPYVPTPSSNDQMRLWAIKQASALSLRACDVTRRAQLAVLRGETPAVVRCDDELTKLAGAADDPVNRLAEQYALYKLAFLSAIPEQDPDLALTTNLVIVQNYTA